MNEAMARTALNIHARVGFRFAAATDGGKAGETRDEEEAAASSEEGVEGRSPLASSGV